MEQSKEIERRAVKHATSFMPLANLTNANKYDIAKTSYELGMTDGVQFVTGNYNELLSQRDELVEVLNMMIHVCRGTYGKEFEEWIEYKTAQTLLTKINTKP